MKKIYFLFAIFSGFANAQIVNFSDSHLKTRVLESSADNMIAKNLDGNYFAVDSNNDGEIQLSEAAQVTYLYAKQAQISNFGGISYFSNLNELDCSWNGTFIQPFTIDLSGMPNLKKLTCYDNVFATPDISSFSELENLEMGYCRGFDSLDLTAFHNLKVFDCGRMHLSSLNVNGLSNLEELYFAYNEISTLDISTLTNLKILYSDYTDLVSLDAGNLTHLESLVCKTSPLASLHVNGCINLHEINCSTSQLTTLDVHGNNALQDLRCDGSLLANLDISGCDNLGFVSCSSGRLTSLDASNLSNLHYLNCSIALIQNLNILGSDNITELQCYDNQLTALDCNNLHNLNILYCEGNPLVSLYANNGSIESTLYYGTENGSLMHICVDESQVAYYQSHLPNPNCVVDSACSALNITQFSPDVLVISPNPVNDVLNVSTDQKITSVNVYNVLGQLVLEIANQSDYSAIDVSVLKSGNYFLELNCGSGNSIKRFVKR